MAIAPIDLQTLYSQLENVSKTVVHQQQGVQLSQAIQQETNAKQVAEKSTAVQQLKQDKDDVLSVKDKKSSGGGQNSGERKRREQNDDAQAVEGEEPFRFQDPNLGKYVDISG